MAALVTWTALALGATEFHVSPAGRPTGYGSADWPWDLQTALNQPAAVRAGDTIWLHAGTYRGKFNSRLAGAPTAPIIVRAFPGEKAVIDSNSTTLLPATLSIQGRDTWFWDLEVTNSNPTRNFSTSGSNPDSARPTGVDIQGPRVKVINCVVHDNGNGFGFWDGADDAEVYGNIIFNNGWDAPDRGHGHSVYGQNRNGIKRIVDNIYFNAFSHGLHIYGSGTAYINNFHIEGNIGFNNGRLSFTGITRNILLGGGSVARDGVVRNNATYFSPDTRYGQNNFGYSAGCVNLRLQDNYFANSGNLLVNCTVGAMISGNLFHFSTNFGESQFPGNSFQQGRLSAPRVLVRPNQYERGRAHVAVFNWDGQSTINVGMAGILNVGDRYEVWDAQNYLDTPIATGTYGGAIPIPMTGTRFTPAVGAINVTQIHTSPEFGSFVVRKRNAGGPIDSPPPNLPPSVFAGSDQTVTLPAQASLNGTAKDDGRPTGILSIAWSKVSGPGAVSFANPGAASTTATFGVAGTYTLRLTASDGVQAVADDVIVTANPAPTPVPVTNTVRINAGGGAYVDANGNRWEADRYFSGGNVYQVAAVVAAASGAPLYQSHRYGAHSYNIPLPNGQYSLRLRFAEVYFASAGERVFGVNMNGQPIIRDFDVFVAAGGFRRAVDRQFPATVTNGQLRLDFVVQKEYPQVSAIEIVPAAPGPQPEVAITVTPASATLTPGQSVRLTATVSNAGNAAVSWKLNNAIGAISTSGEYTAPATTTVLQTVVVTAVSAADPRKTASAQITLLPTATPQGALFRVNAGGAGFSEGLNNSWSGDAGAVGGSTYLVGTPIANTTLQSLYRSCRFGAFSYRLNVPNGIRKVRLRFAELYFTNPGRRVFQVNINGTTVLNNFDIVQQAGGAFRALDYEFTVNVTGGQLNIQFRPQVENPMVNGIEVF